MKLIKFSHRYDFGHDWTVQILDIKRWSLFQVSVGWCEYPMWPFIQIKSGTGHGLSILFWAHKFGLDIDVLSRTWDWGQSTIEDDENESD